MRLVAISETAACQERLFALQTTQRTSTHTVGVETGRSVPPQVSQNIEALEDYYERAEQSVGAAQRLLERFSAPLGQPWFLGVIVLFTALWITYNLLAPTLGLVRFDPPPFSALQGVVSLSALLITTIVLIGQNRLARLERQREQLELHVNILTEQKTTKLLHLIEELRHDLPMVRDRHDPDAATLQEPTDTAGILNALEKKSDDREKSGK
jgi:uncharacterized membrane protein